MEPSAGRAVDWIARLRGDWLFWGLVLLVAVLALRDPARVPDYPALVDWHTIAALAGLLVLTRGLEVSGGLHRLTHALLRRVHTERTLALALVLVSAALATVITNDVALFVVVPMTLMLRQYGDLPVGRLVIFEALAVNAGSALTPIGNPQNLFLWQQAGVSFGTFTLAMLPLVALLMGALLALTALAFRPLPLEVGAAPELPLRPRLLVLSLLLYPPFLLLANAGRPELGVLVIVLLFAALRREVLAGVDWPLLAVFILMFIAFRLLAEAAEARGITDALPLDDPAALFLAGALLSQAVSNVPAAIVLADLSTDWRALAWGVSVGGFGLVIGSLASIIALRLLREPRAWLLFHVWAVPFFVIATGVVWLWLRGASVLAG